MDEPIYLNYLEEVMGPFLRMEGAEIFDEDVDKQITEEYFNWELPFTPPPEFGEKYDLYNRTVISKYDR